MTIAAVIQRLEAMVPSLAGRIEGAMQFAELMRSGNLPQVTPAAHVLPLGLQGGQPDVMTGAFRQPIARSIAVVLTIRTYDVTAGREVDPLNSLIDEILAAIAGWTPDSTVGVYRLSRAGLVSMAAGTVIYQIDFSIDDQLRILA